VLSDVDDKLDCQVDQPRALGLGLLLDAYTGHGAGVAAFPRGRWWAQRSVSSAGRAGARPHREDPTVRTGAPPSRPL
jgi:hypothetical protein